MIINCSQPLSPEYPGSPEDPVTLEVETSVQGQITVSTLHLGAHAGTHIDTPAHFDPGAENSESFTPAKFKTTALWVYCEPSTRGFTLAPSLDPGSFPESQWIFLGTGWGQRWGDTAYYEDFPGLDPSLLEDFLDLPLTGIGLDGPSIDSLKTASHLNHLAWLKTGRFILENLRWNESIEDGKVYRTYIAPLSVHPLEAIPCRVFHDDSEVDL